MDKNEKKLIQLREKLSAFKNFKERVEKVLETDIDALEQLSEDLYYESNQIEKELDDLKMEMELPDERWYEDERNK